MFTFPISRYTLAAIVAGFLLDAALGDPENPFHPVRLIGWCIARLSSLGLMLKSRAAQLLYGAAMTAVVVAGSYLLAFGLTTALYQLHPLAGFACEAVLCYFVLAARSLCNEGMGIYRALCSDALPEARTRLSRIVGRDTAKLGEEKIVKATVETLAENLSDGVIAPLFYALIGGVPLAVAYKAVNTLDSMVGYRNETYAFLGRCAARLDDAVNLVPARLSALLLLLATLFCNQSANNALRIYLRDRYNHLSPNSAHTEAVCAGALGIRLGGPSVYGGRVVEKATIGDNKRPAVAEDIRITAKMMYLAAVEGLAAGVTVILLLIM